MATLKYFTKGNGNPTTIYLRFINGRDFDFKRSTSKLINPKYWNNTKGCVREVAEYKDKSDMKKDLNTLRSFVLNSFIDTYSDGGLINADWLGSTIKKYFNQDDANADFNYFTDYAEHFHKNLPTKVQKNGKTGVTIATLKKYRTIINKIEDFEKYQKKRLKIIDVNLKFHEEFIYFLHNVQRLNVNTTGKYLVFVKTICLSAKKYVKINKEIQYDEWRQPKEDVAFITLSETEINTIYDHDFSKTPYLENARNWLIIGVWTGARVSDLLKFTKDNIENGFIEYTAQKTAQRIVLPLHPQVVEILKNLNGEFPRQISSQKFNDYIKTVCEFAGINEMVEGSKLKQLKPKVWRKTKGEFEKWQLVSTHICRRSFADNHYGKLSTTVLMAVTGHTTEQMLLNYIKKAPLDKAEILKEFWQNKEDKKNQRPPELKVIKTAN